MKTNIKEVKLIKCDQKQYEYDLELIEKIDKALKTIKVDSNCNWYVPNRQQLNMSIKEFADFERARLLEFEKQEIRETKYREHYEANQEDQTKQEGENQCLKQ